MIFSRLFVVVFIVGFKEIYCGPVGKIEDPFGNGFPGFLPFPGPFHGTGQHFPNPNSNFIYPSNYVPTHVSGQKHGYILYNKPDMKLENNPLGKNGKFAVPWLDLTDDFSATKNEDNLGPTETNQVNLEEDEGNFNRFINQQKNERYEVNEERKEPDIPSSSQNNYNIPPFNAGFNFGFNPNHGFFPGFGPRHHHNHGFHHHPGFPHNHGPNCFPFGNRRRPRPPLPTTTTPTSTTVAASIDPRASSVAEVVTTEGPGIDIRFGRDTIRQNGDDSIVFPEGR